MSNLYVVSTPIGNLQDVSIRASNLLLELDLIIAESASKAGTLLTFLEKQFQKNRNPNLQIVSLSENEEELKIPSILKLLATRDAALISEAGTPLISDPGFKLVRESIKRGINLIPIPGPTAAVAALSISGLPTDKFFFLGFLPKKEGKRLAVLNSLFDIKKSTNPTLIIYESPHRVIQTLQELLLRFGNTDIVIAREITKIHEEVRREKLSESIGHFTKAAPRGEFVILL